MSDHTYVVRFGWTPRDLIMVPACLLFIVVGTWMAVDRQWIGVACALLGAAYLAILVTTGLIRRVALAVTAEGVTLGMLPPWPADRSASVPWSDIDAVVLWRQRVWRFMLWPQSIYWIGLERRAAAPPLSGSARNPTLRRIGKAVVPEHVSEDLMVDSRQIAFWRLDKERLRAAVDHFGGGVPVDDRT